jgi:hypothetical protein
VSSVIFSYLYDFICSKGWLEAVHAWSLDDNFVTTYFVSGIAHVKFVILMSC